MSDRNASISVAVHSWVRHALGSPDRHYFLRATIPFAAEGGPPAGRWATFSCEGYGGSKKIMAIRGAKSVADPAVDCHADRGVSIRHSSLRHFGGRSFLRRDSEPSPFQPGSEVD